jgi:type II secretory pathway pseudopilin PulG
MSSGNKFNSNGFTLIEIVVATAIFMIMAGGMAIIATGSHLTGLENTARTQAGAVLTETWEALRAIRNNNWGDIVNGDHGLSSAGGAWHFEGENDLVNGITRGITVEDVFRDAEGDIAEAGGGDNDADSKKITVRLSWEPEKGQIREAEVRTYLHNYAAAAPWPNE